MESRPEATILHVILILPTFQQGIQFPVQKLLSNLFVQRCSVASKLLLKHLSFLVKLCQPDFISTVNCYIKIFYTRLPSEFSYVYHWETVPTAGSTFLLSIYHMEMWPIITAVRSTQHPNYASSCLPGGEIGGLGLSGEAVASPTGVCWEWDWTMERPETPAGKASVELR